MKKNVHPFVPSYFDSLNSDKISSYCLKKNKKKNRKTSKFIKTDNLYTLCPELLPHEPKISHDQEDLCEYMSNGFSS